MEAFASKRTVRVDLDDGEWVDIREKLRFGDWLILARDREIEKGDTTEFQVHMLQKAIVDWSFEEDGTKVPVTRQNIEALDLAVALRLLNVAAEQYKDPFGAPPSTPTSSPPSATADPSA